MRTPRPLRSGRDFERVLGSGTRAARAGVVAVAVRNDEPAAASRLGLAVRSSRGAVGRNRTKRRLRAAYRSIETPLGYDIVVRADDRASSREFKTMAGDLEAAVTKATGRRG